MWLHLNLLSLREKKSPQARGLIWKAMIRIMLIFLRTPGSRLHFLEMSCNIYATSKESQEVLAGWPRRCWTLSVAEGCMSCCFGSFLRKLRCSHQGLDESWARPPWALESEGSLDTEWHKTEIVLSNNRNWFGFTGNDAAVDISSVSANQLQR